MEQFVEWSFSIVRWLLGVGVAGLVTLLVWRFNKLDARIEKLEASNRAELQELNSRLAMSIDRHGRELTEAKRVLHDKIEKVERESRSERTGIATSLRAMLDNKAGKDDLDRAETRFVAQVSAMSERVMEHVRVLREHVERHRA